MPPKSVPGAGGTIGPLPGFVNVILFQVPVGRHSVLAIHE